MNPFWSGFFQQFKDCGRGVMSFFLGVLVLLGLLIGALILDKTNAGPQVLMGTAVLLVIWSTLVIRRALRYRNQRLHFSRLSSDELLKARSKLKNGFTQRNSFKPARFERPPDTDLKF